MIGPFNEPSPWAFAVPLRATGKVLSKDGTSCHTMLYQGTKPTLTPLDVTGMAFEHPAEIGAGWKERNCKDGHAGQYGLPT
ncbi:MAG TPA: hypothetical protein VI542_11105 [Candidatus Tectomicrobia bacterium]